MPRLLIERKYIIELTFIMVNYINIRWGNRAGIFNIIMLSHIIVKVVRIVIIESGRG